MHWFNAHGLESVLRFRELLTKDHQGPTWMAAIIAYIIHMLLKNPNSPGTTQRGDGCRYVITLMRKRMGAAVRRIRPL